MQPGGPFPSHGGPLVAAQIAQVGAPLSADPRGDREAREAATVGYVATEGSARDWSLNLSMYDWGNGKIHQF